MACTLPCCGTFCFFVSIICGIMQFVFYGLLATNSERLDIGESEAERTEYSKTALWTAIVYSGFVVISVGCIMGGGRKKAGFEALPTESDDEQTNLIDDDEPSVSYDATKDADRYRPIKSSVDSSKKHTIQ